MSPAVILLLGIISAPPPGVKVPPPDPVYGLVVDEKGQPVEGAEVLWCCLSNRKIETLWQGWSDARGGFRVDRTEGYVSGLIPTLDSFAATAYLPGWRPDTVKVGERTTSSPDEPVRLVLRRPTGANVNVLGPDGAPVAGATVRVRGLFAFPEALFDRLAATTGADGRAVLTAFSAEDSLVLRVSAPGFGTQPFGHRSEDNGVTTAALRAPGRLMGRVIANDPARARGVTVRGDTMAGPTVGQATLVGTFEGVSDADGRFEVPAVAAGWVRLDALHPAPDLFTLSSFFSDRQLLPKLEAGSQVEIEVKLHRGFPVRGVVYERGTGRPIAGATVEIGSAPAGGYSTVRSNAEGRFEGFVGPGRVTARLGYAGPFVTVAGAPPVSGTLTEDSKGIDIGTIEVVQGVEVSGVVLDEGGKPVAGAEVEAWTAAGGRVVARRSSINPALIANRQGRFVLKGMEPGVALLLAASSGDAASGRPETFMPGERKEAELVIRQANTKSLGGRVLDEYGKPMAGANVIIESRWTSPGAVPITTFSPFVNKGLLKTDVSGRFQTPRFLPAYAEHRAKVFGAGIAMGWTDWFAPTTPSLFDLYLDPYPPPGQEQIRANIDAGLAHYFRGDYEAAETSYEKALAEADKGEVDNPLAYSEWLARLTEARLVLEKYEDAEALGRRVLALRKGVLEADHPSIAAATTLIAKAYEGQGEMGKAADLFREVSIALERSTGPDSPRFAHALSRLGACEAKLGQLDQAETDLTRCVAITERALGHDNEYVASATLRLARVFEKLDRPGEAEAAYRKALAAYEAVCGVDHPNTLLAVDDLAELLRNTGRVAEAEALEARAKASRARREKPPSA